MSGMFKSCEKGAMCRSWLLLEALSLSCWEAVPFVQHPPWGLGGPGLCTGHFHSFQSLSQCCRLWWFSLIGHHEHITPICVSNSSPTPSCVTGVKHVSTSKQETRFTQQLLTFLTQVPQWALVLYHTFHWRLGICHMLQLCFSGHNINSVNSNIPQCT